mmetsp:Transcript_7362/g.12210  ORF Transcript_7362/g.12210 Transcript_7362/m.12210 type:complete len:227 (+) Transcript_7362:195-875(+)
MMKHLLLFSLVLLIGSCQGRELLRRENEGMEIMEMEVDYSGQRRELAWGSGFSWFMYTMKLCHGPGKMCPKPPCGGPHHKAHPEWGCHGSNSTTTTTSTSDSSTYDATSTEEYYEYIDEEDGENGGNGNRAAGEVAGGFSTFGVIAYVLGGTALAAMLAAVVFKKRRGSLDQETLEGSVARRLDLLNSGDGAPELPAADPPTFIELPASTSAVLPGGDPTTTYVSV